MYQRGKVQFIEARILWPVLFQMQGRYKLTNGTLITMAGYEFHSSGSSVILRWGWASGLFENYQRTWLMNGFWFWGDRKFHKDVIYADPCRFVRKRLFGYLSLA